MSFGELMIIYLIVGIVCGFVCMAIASSRNMEGGFWWGFWLGIIGIIIVAVRPNDNHTYQPANNNSYSTTTSYNTESPPKPGTYYASYTTKEHKREDNILENGGWHCPKCGKTNYSYAISCICGEKRPVESAKKHKMSRENNKQSDIISESEIIKYLKEYKELLDNGILTIEEFEKKKAQLLKNPVAVDTPVEEDKAESPPEIIHDGINPKGEKAVYPIPSDEYNMVLCPKCKTKQRANRHLCQNCGFPFMYEE